MIGISIRIMKDVGAHQRKYKTGNMTVEDEMWKHAFWEKKPIIDLAIECDDEYWDHPDPSEQFIQPPNIPSLATAFIIYIKVLQILNSLLRSIKPKFDVFRHLVFGRLVKVVLCPL
ncbi:hypothetical protein L208DRAFT_1377823 [Tricholoma matsutake]|nr:hypothetical protein L208DRAFT_1377823 [Tricholoma matsutake 945]